MEGKKLLVFPQQMLNHLGVRVAIQMAAFFGVDFKVAPAVEFKLGDIGMKADGKYYARNDNQEGQRYSLIQFECKLIWDGEEVGGCGPSLITKGEYPFVRPALRDLSRYLVVPEEYNLTVGEISRRWFELCCAYLTGGMDALVALGASSEQIMRITEMAETPV